MQQLLNSMEWLWRDLSLLTFSIQKAAQDMFPPGCGKETLTWAQGMELEGSEKKKEKQQHSNENPPRIKKATRTLPELVVVVFIGVFYGVLCCLIEERKWMP